MKKDDVMYRLKRSDANGDTRYYVFTSFEHIARMFKIMRGCDCDTTQIEIIDVETLDTIAVLNPSFIA